MTFLHQFSLLWLLAWAASALFGLSICWLIIFATWQLSRKPFVSLEKRSNLSKPGELDALLTPPKKETVWIGVAKMLVLAAGLLGAYEVGTRTSDAQKAVYLEQWKHQHAAWEATNAQWQKAYTDFLAKHKELSNANAIR